MQVITNVAPSDSPIAGIQHTTIAGSENGLRQLSIWQQIVAPGGATPPHTHDCEEVVMCTAGRGEVLLGNGRRLEFRAQQTLVIPAHELHQIVNSGDEPLHSIGVFGKSPVNVYLPDGQAIDLPWPT